MSKLIEALIKFGKKCSSEEVEPTGNTVDEVLESIAENFDINGADGDDGLSVTAIKLTTTEGAVTGGEATLSDGSKITITVEEE